jgi:hypothetical protein
MTCSTIVDGQTPRTRARLRRERAIALAVVLALAPGAAMAQGSDQKAIAESLFQKGKELMAQGNAAEACPRFEESQRLDPSVGTMLNLARCHAELGKTASAWAEYKQAATMARTAGQTEREQAAKEFAEKLKPKLSYLRIDAPKAMPGLEVRRNGELLGAPALGVAIAVDPGAHAIEAKAPGYKPWSTTIEVGKEADDKAVSVPALEVDPNAKGRDEVEPGKTGGGSNGLRTAAFVVGGLGVAALGAGAVFGGLAASDVGKAEPLCPSKACNAAGYDLIEGAQTKALVSTLGLAVGGAALGAGVVLFLVSRSPAKEGARGAWIVPSFGPRGGGASLVGSF